MPDVLTNFLSTGAFQDQCNRNHTLWRGISEFLFMLHIYCPVLVKFGIWKLHIMLWIICEFLEIWCIEGPICPVVWIKWHVLWNCDFWN